jgi:GT2 family glycosyltransferase
MKLSIIIVNYNVVYFLEQCLYAVHAAIKNIDAEIFVVDNNSVDGSNAMVKEKFPDVKLIENKINVGFSKANNQAIKISTGEYALLLNPDTVVEEDTFKKVIKFMDDHQDAGGLGVKMIDGKGNFLPESKRGLPTPSVAFYKISGISRLFPRSKKFGKYHLGYLDKNKTNPVDVLAGAFMLLRKSVLDQIGLLDETFFMYGEDIDLSYRITEAGYKNYYFSDTTIIHYKGESTKKGSINYVRVFYNAMIIFANKHFTKKNAKLFSFLINIAIYLRAGIALLSRFIKNAFLPLIDAVLIFLGFFFIKPYWEAYKFPEGGTYPDEFLLYAVPGYILVWLFSIYLTGGYEKPAKILNILKGILLGTLLILVTYALLSEDYRFSRALILIGSAWGFITIISTRLFFNIINISPYKLYSNKKKRVVVIGSTEEADRVCNILNQSENKPHIVGYIEPKNNGNKSSYIGNLNQLQDIIRVNKIDELIFCAKDITAQNIIKNMLALSDVNIEYKIASPDSISVIGSNSINTSGDLYTINLNSIARYSNKRNKRLLDISISLLSLCLLPFLLVIQKKPLKYLYNIFKVLFGFSSWVGYKINAEKLDISLPKIKSGILTPSDVANKEELSIELIDRLNIAYARDYKILNDLSIIVKGIRLLGK